MLRTTLCLALLVACGDDGGSSNPDGNTGDGGGATKKIFVTSADFPGGFASNDPISGDGAALADMQCQSAAQAGGLTGTFKAWMSRYGSAMLPARTAPERITGEGPWHLTGTNELVFLNRAALANTPRVPINRSELGTPVTGGSNVWTGTAIGGALGTSDCERWTTSNSGGRGTVGTLSATTSEWTDIGITQSCGTRAHLYCLEM